MAVHSSSSRSMRRASRSMGWRCRPSAFRRPAPIRPPAAGGQRRDAAQHAAKPAWSASSWPASGPSAGDQDSTAPSMMKQRVSASPCRRSRSMVCVVMEQVASPAPGRSARPAAPRILAPRRRTGCPPVPCTGRQQRRSPAPGVAQPAPQQHAGGEAQEVDAHDGLRQGRVQPPVAGQVGQRGREDGFRRLRQARAMSRSPAAGRRGGERGPS